MYTEPPPAATFTSTPHPKPQLRVPEDKHDLACIAILLEHPDTADLYPLVPTLLTWLQDRNWPIFGGVTKVLLRIPEAVVEPVREVLKGNDDEWQYDCLAYLLPYMRRKELKELRADIEALRAKTDGGYGKDWDMREEIDIVMGKIDEESEKEGKKEREE
jgi:hypothetical protein